MCDLSSNMEKWWHESTMYCKLYACVRVYIYIYIYKAVAPNALHNVYLDKCL